jgi:hypothetical protein
LAEWYGDVRKGDKMLKKLFKRIQKKKDDLPVWSQKELLNPIQTKVEVKPETKRIESTCVVIGEIREPEKKRPSYITIGKDGMETHHFTREPMAEKTFEEQLNEMSRPISQSV